MFHFCVSFYFSLPYLYSLKMSENPRTLTRNELRHRGVIKLTTPGGKLEDKVYEDIIIRLFI